MRKSPHLTNRNSDRRNLTNTKKTMRRSTLKSLNTGHLRLNQLDRRLLSLLRFLRHFINAYRINGHNLKRILNSSLNLKLTGTRRTQTTALRLVRRRRRRRSSRHRQRRNRRRTRRGIINKSSSIMTPKRLANIDLLLRRILRFRSLTNSMLHTSLQSITRIRFRGLITISSHNKISTVTLSVNSNLTNISLNQTTRTHRRNQPRRRRRRSNRSPRSQSTSSSLSIRQQQHDNHKAPLIRPKPTEHQSTLEQCAKPPHSTPNTITTRPP